MSLEELRAAGYRPLENFVGGVAVPVWVQMPPRAFSRFEPCWDLEALWYPHDDHPSGKNHLVKVRYDYIMFFGWVKRERIRPRNV